MPSLACSRAPVKRDFVSEGELCVCVCVCVRVVPGDGAGGEGGLW